MAEVILFAQEGNIPGEAALIAEIEAADFPVRAIRGRPELEAALAGHNPEHTILIAEWDTVLDFQQKNELYGEFTKRFVEARRSRCLDLIFLMKRENEPKNDSFRGGYCIISAIASIPDGMHDIVPFIRRICLSPCYTPWDNIK